MQNTPSPPPLVSDDESNNYYYGLHSKPVLIARTGSIPWERPKGPEAYLKPKELRGVSGHKIQDSWGGTLAPKILAILAERNVDWSSLDVVRIAYADEYPGDVIVWIGIRPNSLSRKDGMDVALQCKQVLLDHHIIEVEVEIRQPRVSNVTQT